MDFIKRILNQEGFLKAIFKAIPCGVLVIDVQRRIHAVNDAFKQTFNVISGKKILYTRPGDALKCLNAGKGKGCGYENECKACKIRSVAVKALSGSQIYREKASLKIQVNGDTKEIVILISAAPFEHKSKRMAVIMIENLSQLSDMHLSFITKKSFRGIIGSTHRMRELFNLIKEVAEVDVPVLIQGESGTGKELVANAIHYESYRSSNLFVPVNCAALPEGLLESELFGHVKGAFTGAIRDKKGRFELANGGTLFLDEVADIPKLVQVKLLRVLQEGVFEPVGSEKSISADVRIISATNKNLKEEVEKGNFREDLYYRINVVPIHVPPLRERKEDIPLLVEYFLNTISQNKGITGVSDEAMEIMLEYDWPGNVRELQSAISFASIKAKGNIITKECLPRELHLWKKSLRSSRRTSRKLNKENVKNALITAGGNKAKAARLLGVGRATLYRFLKEFPEAAFELKL